MMTINALFLVLLVVTKVSSTVSLDELFLFANCHLDLNYTPNDAFVKNLNTLLGNLTEHSRSSLSYNITTVGNDEVYGDVLCRGDVNLTVCANCVQLAAKEVTERCGLTGIATVWYDHCQLRYSFLKIPGEEKYSGQYVKDTPMTGPMRVQVENFLGTLSKEAIKDENKYFKTGELKYSEKVVFYGLVQCKPTGKEKCLECLNAAVKDSNGTSSVVSDQCAVRLEKNIRFFDSPPDLTITLPGNKNSVWVVALSVLLGFAVLVVVLAFCVVRRIRKFEGKERRKLEMVKALVPPEEIVAEPNDFASIEWMKMDFRALSAATEDFSEANEIGRGAFGVVYKGVLPDGKEIAAKRLSKGSWQGIKEFKTEVETLMKLQHTNLVKLLGWAVEVQEKVLVYEYMENNTLHNFIFNAERRATLNWDTCFGIIKGIARGLIYLHEESRSRILHRDLKPHNVLLDKNMVAKISDFGMAKNFDSQYSTLATTKPVGTFGYMAPEYAMKGELSEKTDVFSFGVIVLEMLSGRKNYNTSEPGMPRALLSYAWQLWINGRQAEFLETPLKEAPCRREILRCMQIGLLCVQEKAEERPLMSSVFLYLSEPSPLSQPKQPGTFMRRQTVLPVSLSTC